jgi:hypothetical protein
MTHALLRALGLLILIALGAAVLAVLKAAAAGRKPLGLGNPWPLEPKKPLSTPEQQLYFRLVEALPAEIVLAQVQLQSFLKFRRGSKAAGVRNRYERLSADFLVCTTKADVIAAIELDDKSHERTDRLAADARKNHALASAGIPLIRWNVRQLPTGEQIRGAIATAKEQRFPTQTPVTLRPLAPHPEASSK